MIVNKSEASALSVPENNLDWNDPDWLVHRLNRICEAFPDSCAVKDKYQEISFGDLKTHSDALSIHLKKLRRGNTAGAGIMAERGVSFIVAMVAAWKAGFYYVPIDKNLSEKQRQERLSLSGCEILMDVPSPLLQSADFSVVEVTALLQEKNKAENKSINGSNIAYVMFTSGTTGTPKAVAITKTGLAHYCVSLLKDWQFNGESAGHFACVSPLTTDLGNTGIFLSLMGGGCLHIFCENTIRSPEKFWEWISAYQRWNLKITPLHFEALWETQFTEKQKQLFDRIIFGGDRLTIKLVKKIFEAGLAKFVVNHYGPTETTIGSFCNFLTPKTIFDDTTVEVPIGRPIGKTQFKILETQDENEKFVSSGELLISGPGVAAGYLGDPGLTSYKFPTSAQDHGLRYYKTGDICSPNKDGLLVFHGRSDRQLKIRGFRVELPAIESALLKHPMVKGAVVVGMGDGADRYLAAALVLTLPSQSESVLGEIKFWLAQNLPPYMVPRDFHIFQKIPLNTNEKPDYRAIEKDIALRATEEKMGDEFLSELDETVRVVLSVVQGCLRRNDIKTNLSLFDQGLDSITAMQLCGALYRHDIGVYVQDIYEYKTINELVRFIKQGREKPHTPRSFAHYDNGAALDEAELWPVQKWFFDQDFSEPDHWNQAVMLKFRDTIDEFRLNSAVSAIMQRHDGLSRLFKQNDDGWHTIRSSEPIHPSLIIVTLKENGAMGAEQELAKIVSEAHSNISITNGPLISFTVIRQEKNKDKLLIVCHHLAVDVVSWLVLLGDLSWFYRMPSSRPVVRPVTQAHLSNALWSAVEEKIHPFDAPAVGEKKPGSLPVDNVAGSNREDMTSTISCVIQPSSLLKLEEACLIQKVKIHEILLSAFLASVSDWSGIKTIDVDVETHGRETNRILPDLSQTVGWFTVINPCSFILNPDDFSECLEKTTEELRKISALDAISHAIRFKASETPNSELMFNYMGLLPLDEENGLWSISTEYAGPARSPSSDRIYKFKLGGRKLGGQLVIDLSYSSALYKAETSENIVKGIVKAFEVFVSDQILYSCQQHAYSTSGLPFYTPSIHVNLTQQKIGTPKNCGAILLTGGTGFLGSHLLNELINSGEKKIYSLIRGSSDMEATKRLRRNFEFYFGKGALTKFDAEVTVLAGDVRRQDLGLTPENYKRIALEVGSIYHAAADTRLHVNKEEIFGTNVQATENIISLAEFAATKSIYYVSTLSVAGKSADSEQGEREFDEETLDYGQSFLNSYEESKFRAELLVNQFFRRGGHGQIYRFDNLSANSQTGIYQINHSDNLICQAIRTYLTLGCAPSIKDLTLRFSPVDIVGKAIVALSKLRPKTETYHVETPYEASFDDLLQHIGELYGNMEIVDYQDFLERCGGDCPEQCSKVVGVAG